MSRPLRIGLALIVILVIGLVTAAGVFVYTADYNRYRGLIEKKDLGELGPLFDTQLHDLGPFRINSQLSGSDERL